MVMPQTFDTFDPSNTFNHQKYILVLVDFEEMQDDCTLHLINPKNVAI